jgi:hypothetical protein
VNKDDAPSFWASIGEEEIPRFREYFQIVVVVQGRALSQEPFLAYVGNMG